MEKEEPRPGETVVVKMLFERMLYSSQKDRGLLDSCGMEMDYGGIRKYRTKDRLE